MPGRDAFLRRFRQHYAREHLALQRAIRGLPAAQRSAAASAILHRLMALHFLQQAGFANARAILPAQQDFDIPDAAFQRLFDFFGRYEWRLEGGADDAIDPPLLGALFEAHINQKELGAYYTRDDITTYIVDHTVLPWLLERLSEVGGIDPVWRLLRERPGRYRCRRGDVATVNDLVTASIDIRRLALDAISQGCSNFVERVRTLLQGISILDPTCGSGAFLFAAWSLLDDLWRAGGVSPPWSDILNQNLFGIDLMPEAVELCRILMLLKRVSQSPRGPLPLLERCLAVGNVLAPLPWPERERDGFDLIIGNPPYLPARQVDYAATGYVTADCPDIYAWIMERSARLLKPGGRSGLIVPLSLGFSERFAACRQMLFEEYDVNWFSSFGRIPDALFNFDVRIRNTIHLGRKQSDAAIPHQAYSTRLHRWFEAERPELFRSITYSRCDPSLWQGRVPKPNTDRLATALESRLRAYPGHLEQNVSSRPTRHRLYFKKTAYNWLTFCRRLPPCYDAAGQSVPQTQFDTLHFPSAELRDLAFLFLNGKWTFAWWCIVGDDFHVARWMLEGFPLDLASIPPRLRRRLLPLAHVLETAMLRAIAFKRNAGKRIGTYNLARCRAVTDRSDRLLGEHMGLSDVWDDVQLLCDQVIKTEFDSPQQDRSQAVAACGQS